MVKPMKYLHLSLSAGIILIGLMMILRPQFTASALAAIVGCMILAVGILKIICYFVKDMYNLAFQFDLALGICFFIMGVVLLIHPEDLVTVLPIAIGFGVLVDGAFKLQTALDAKRFGLPKWWTIVVLAVLTIAAGLVLILKPADAVTVIVTIMGVSLIIDGLQNLCVTAYTVRLMRKRME